MHTIIQIDYILIRNEHRLFVKDSRSYMGTTTHSDHRLVMANMNINWHWKTRKKTNTKEINIERLNDIETRTKYQQNVENRLKDKMYDNEQDRWNRR